MGEVGGRGKGMMCGNLFILFLFSLFFPAGLQFFQNNSYVKRIWNGDL